jgi:putative (di)nucleoside polyphosphate hydrolase
MAPFGLTFRAGVGALVIDARGLVLACERAERPGSWQLPQGGLDGDEEPSAAVLRELEEETGIGRDCVQLLAEHPEWIAYEVPLERRRAELGRGQVQRWFLLRFLGTDRDIDLGKQQPPEFRAWRWMPMSELIELVIEFRRPVYRKLAAQFAAHLR